MVKSTNYQQSLDFLVDGFLYFAPQVIIFWELRCTQVQQMTTTFEVSTKISNTGHHSICNRLTSYKANDNYDNENHDDSDYNRNNNNDNYHDNDMVIVIATATATAAATVTITVTMTMTTMTMMIMIKMIMIITIIKVIMSTVRCGSIVLIAVVILQMLPGNESVGSKKCDLAPL